MHTSYTHDNCTIDFMLFQILSSNIPVSHGAITYPLIYINYIHVVVVYSLNMDLMSRERVSNARSGSRGLFYKCCS